MSVVTPAASVLLTRGPGSREVFAILRGHHLRFFGGFWAFPGGKLTTIESDSTDHLTGRRLAACRELFEETGVLIARTPDGAFPSIDTELQRSRESLVAEQVPFEQVLGERQLTIRADDFKLIGEITTPDFAAVRFATTFFMAYMPPNQTANVRVGELERGEWAEGRELIARWRRGEILLTPPSMMSLETLGDRPVADAPSVLGPLFEHLAEGAEHPIYFAPAVRMIPLKTRGLPPSTHTNAILIGNGPRYLIDPGPEDADEQQRLFRVLGDDGGELSGIVLTHHHPDHVGAAAVCAKRYRAPIWAHARTADKLSGRVVVDRLLNEGDRLPLGARPDGGGAWHLETMHTPGHASGHLIFFEPFYRLLIAGDMISTLTSMVIAPPDGNLAEYLQSLRRLRALPTRLLLPAHGNVTARPALLMDDALAHRAKREAQLLDALAEGPFAIDDLTARLYRGTPEALMRFARAQVLAGLIKLKDEGRVRTDDDRVWRLH